MVTRRLLNPSNGDTQTQTSSLSILESLVLIVTDVKLQQCPNLKLFNQEMDLNEIVIHIQEV